MMEDLSFCETPLGKDIRQLANDINLVARIDKVIIELEALFGKSINEPGWKELYQVIVEMKNSFDNDFYRDENKLSSLSAKVEEIVLDYYLNISRGGLREALYHLCSVI